MGDSLTVVGVAGSLRSGSYNRALLRSAVDLAPDDMIIEPFDLGSLPFYDADLDTDDARPGPVRELKERIAGADAVLVATPEYNHGIPGVLTNALDWASRPAMKSPMAHKPVGFMGASPGLSGTMRGQQVLKMVLLGMIARVFPHPGVAVGRCKDKFEDGKLTDEATREFIAGYLSDLADWIRTVRRDDSPVPPTGV